MAQENITDYKAILALISAKAEEVAEKIAPYSEEVSSRILGARDRHISFLERRIDWALKKGEDFLDFAQIKNNKFLRSILQNPYDEGCAGLYIAHAINMELDVLIEKTDDRKKSRVLADMVIDEAEKLIPVDNLSDDYLRGQQEQLRAYFYHFRAMVRDMEIPIFKHERTEEHKKLIDETINYARKAVEHFEKAFETGEVKKEHSFYDDTKRILEKYQK